MASTDEQGLKIWAGRSVILEVRYAGGESERMELSVVPDTAADFTRGLLGEGTPLGKAIIGKTAGSSIDYHAGDIVALRVISVSEGTGETPEDLTQRRAEAQRKAVEDADKTSLLIYASSMNSKWGDYDPGILQKDDADADDKEEKA